MAFIDKKFFNLTSTAALTGGGSVAEQLLSIALRIACSIQLVIWPELRTEWYVLLLTLQATDVVASLNVLANEGGVHHVTVLCAAVLHDTIEDTETTADELRVLFGDQLTAVVLEVTDDKSLGVTQPRLNQLLKGKIEFFSLDALVNMATNAGMRVGLSIRPQTSVKVGASAPAKHAPTTKQRLRAAG